MKSTICTKPLINRANAARIWISFIVPSFGLVWVLFFFDSNALIELLFGVHFAFAAYTVIKWKLPLRFPPDESFWDFFTVTGLPLFGPLAWHWLRSKRAG
jgi:hypothetical protein